MRKTTTGPRNAFDVVESFETDNEQRALVVIVVGERGGYRVWLHNDIVTPEQRQWAHRRVGEAQKEIWKFEPGSGSA